MDPEVPPSRRGSAVCYWLKGATPEGLNRSGLMLQRFRLAFISVAACFCVAWVLPASPAFAVRAPFSVPSGKTGALRSVPWASTVFPLPRQYRRYRSALTGAPSSDLFERRVTLPNGRRCSLLVAVLGRARFSRPRVSRNEVTWTNGAFAPDQRGRRGGYRWFLGRDGTTDIAVGFSRAPKGVATSRRRFVEFEIRLDTDAVGEVLCASRAAKEVPVLRRAIAGAHVARVNPAGFAGGSAERMSRYGQGNEVSA